MSTETVLIFEDREYVIPEDKFDLIDFEYRGQRVEIEQEVFEDPNGVVHNLGREHISDFVMIVQNYSDKDFFRNQILSKYLIDVEIEISSLTVKALCGSFQCLQYLCCLLLDNNKYFRNFDGLIRMFKDCTQQYDTGYVKSNIYGRTLFHAPRRLKIQLDTFKEYHSSD